MNEEVHVEELELAPSKEVSKVDCSILSELRGIRALDHQNIMSHLKTHLGYIKPVVVRDESELVASVVLLNKLSPHLLSDESLLVDGVEEDENTTTDALDLSQDLNGLNNPILDIHVSEMIFLSREQQINGVDDQTNRRGEIFEGHQPFRSDL